MKDNVKKQKRKKSSISLTRVHRHRNAPIAPCDSRTPPPEAWYPMKKQRPINKNVRHQILPISYTECVRKNSIIICVDNKPCHDRVHLDPLNSALFERILVQRFCWEAEWVASANSRPERGVMEISCLWHHADRLTSSIGYIFERLQVSAYWGRFPELLTHGSHRFPENYLFW